MAAGDEHDDHQLRSVALQNAESILRARLRAEEALRQTEEALRLNQERLTAALSAARTGTFRWTFASGAIDWDGNLARLFGLEAHEERQTLDAFIAAAHPDDRPAVVAACERSAKNGADFDLEFRVVWADGSEHWMASRAKVSMAPDGTPQYMTGACADVTTRRVADDALREETRVLEVLNATGMALASQLDLESLVQAVTDAATKVTGAAFGAFFYNTTDEHGEAFLLYTLSGAPRDAFEGFGKPRATAIFGPTFHGEAPVRSHDVLADPRYGQFPPHHGMPAGHLPVRSYLAVPVKSRAGAVLGALIFGHPKPGMFTERSERLAVGVAAQAAIAIDNARLYKEAQQSAEERRSLLDSERAARAAAERMSRIKDDFLATVSHELRTPLNAILGWSQILRSGPTTEQELENGLATIERNAHTQAHLIEDLLDMSRITSGKLRLDVQPVLPELIIQEALTTLKPAADAKGIRIESILDPVAGPITGDPARLQQVLTNLLSNAVKFTPKYGKVQVALGRVNSHIEIRVADNGIGVDPDLLPHLFERFRQADASATRAYGGLGLGLAIVKRIVELHGGSVSAASPGLGGGTAVTVLLPVSAVQPDDVSGNRAHPSSPLSVHARMSPSAELAGLRVLIVDDQQDSRELIERVLTASAADVCTASSAEEALAQLAVYKPDVLVSDIGMPDVDGFELLRRVRRFSASEGGRVPAIALTAFARSEDRTKALRAGFSVHVSKPVDATELVATVASVARRW